MSEAAVWLTIVLAGLLTYVTRLSFIILFERLTVPPLVTRGLRYVPPAVLTAIIVPELLLPGGQFDLSLANFRLLAGLAAIAVAWRSRNPIATILVGMGALWLLQFLF
ncbi:MAG: AzlD domain-containing protein [Candidatus Promineifilaceae bacterium]|nr:AzlD domain-containing protein [Candidatus Promineifilaceae bacterium]